LTFGSELHSRSTLPGAHSALWGCAASILILAGCGASEPVAPGSEPEIRLETVEFRAYRGADASASGRAAQAVYRRESGQVEASDALVTLPNPGAPDLTVTAPVLVGDLAARTWSARGGVVLVRGDATARTASARYSAQDGRVRGDEPVEVSGPGYRLAGPAFTADPATGDVEIRGGVRLVVRTGAARP
jgi:lipopolysaccharide export system protein LptC